jgi:hypothetical protein
LDLLVWVFDAFRDGDVTIDVTIDSGNERRMAT